MPPRALHCCRVKHVAMDKYGPEAPQSEHPALAHPVAVAKSVQADFAALVGILDQRLAALGESDSRVRRHVSDAKAAAARGVELSAQLLAALRTVNERDSAPAGE